MRWIVLLLPLLLVSVTAPGEAQLPAALGPVFNGGFELAAHPLRDPLCQVFGDEAVDVLPPEEGGPWLVSVAPCHSGAIKAAGWSSGATTDVADTDNDMDREVRFIAGSCDPNLGCGHNLWQAYANPHQAWTGDFASLDLEVESGVVPSTALIQFSFSTSPLNEAHPFVGAFFECQLSLTAMRGAGPGAIALDPTQGSFKARDPRCDDLDATWNAPGATAADRHGVLQQVRMVQHSYWNWNKGPTDVVIDDVVIQGALSVPEALLP